MSGRRQVVPKRDYPRPWVVNAGRAFSYKPNVRRHADVDHYRVNLRDYSNVYEELEPLDGIDNRFRVFVKSIRPERGWIRPGNRVMVKIIVRIALWVANFTKYCNRRLIIFVFIQSTSREDRGDPPNNWGFWPTDEASRWVGIPHWFIPIQNVPSTGCLGIRVAIPTQGQWYHKHTGCPFAGNLT